MSRSAIFLFFAFAAYAQASVPFNNDEHDVVRVALLRQNRLPPILGKTKFVQNVVQGKILCKECEKFVTTLKKIVDNPSTQQELERTLTTVCDTPVLNRYKGSCLDWVNNLVVIIHDLQWLLDDPTNVCEMTKFCKIEAPSVSSVGKRLALSFASKIVQDIHEPSLAFKIDCCELCENSLNELKVLLQTPDILVAIQSSIELICKIPGINEDKCKEYIEYFFPNIVEKIVNFLNNSEKICSTFKLCKKSSLTNFESITIRQQQPHLDRFLANISSLSLRGFNMGCTLCEAAVKEVVKTLDQPKTLKTIATDVTNVVCKIFPKSLQAGCYDFLNIYGVPSLQLTFSDIMPQQVCQDIHACTASFSQQLQQLPIMEKSVVVCDACKLLSRVLSDELQKASLQQDITNVLTRGCKLIPGDFSKRCNDLVLEYVPTGLSYVADFFTRNDACSFLHLC
jgi:hypothetical protein